MLELHGNIRRVKCFDHHHPALDWEASDEVPRCTRCGSLLRPDVVWFGEGLPPVVLQAAQEAARSCLVFLSVGTSTVVEPAASLPFLALHAGAAVIEVNPADTPLTESATVVLRGTAAGVLPLLMAGASG